MESRTAQTKLKEIVKNYKQLFPAEYKGVCEIVKQKRKGMKDQFGSLKGKDANKTHGVMERALFEISETLGVVIGRQLDKGEFEWFHSKEGSRWFQRNFKEFSLSESF